jgi:hypothetical protein
LEREADAMGERALNEPQTSLIHDSMHSTIGDHQARQMLTTKILGVVIQRNADEILGKTKGRLSQRRGNVWQDIEATRGESYKRTVGGVTLSGDRSLRGKLKAALEEAPEKLKGHLKQVIPFVLMGAGNCMEHAIVAMFEAIKSYEGSEILLMNWEGDHQFALVRKKGEKLEDAIVLDPWSPGENGKKYGECSWFFNKHGREAKNTVALSFDADGHNYLQQALDILMADEGLNELLSNAYKASEKEFERGGLDAEDRETFDESARFKISTSCALQVLFR